MVGETGDGGLGKPTDGKLCKPLLMQGYMPYGPAPQSCPTGHLGGHNQDMASLKLRHNKWEAKVRIPAGTSRAMLRGMPMS